MRATRSNFKEHGTAKRGYAYPFRYKPQDLRKPPGIYAPYQPRFDWNLWFASLGPWQDYRFVVWTEERLLQNEPDVLQFSPGTHLTACRRGKCARSSTSIGSRTVRQSAKPETWWRREALGEYAPPLARGSGRESGDPECTDCFTPSALKFSIALREQNGERASSLRSIGMTTKSRKNKRTS